MHTPNVWHSKLSKTFNEPQQRLPGFLEELHESAEKAFGDNAPQMIENLLYAKMPPHLKKSIHQAFFETGTQNISNERWN